MTLNKYSFAGAILKIEGPSAQSTSLKKEETSEPPNTIDVLKDFLSRRYNPETKLLDLSQTGSDPELLNIGMFDTTSRGSKFFPALMKICDGLFTSPREKEEAVASVSLANNALLNITAVTTLSQTFPHLKNLDLSNNHIPDLKAMESWRWKFPRLERLILSGNPLEMNQADAGAMFMKWYPSLTHINDTQVRSLEEVKAIKSGELPLAVLGPSFHDEAAIAENFIKRFFVNFDSDRNGVVNGYYDNQSTFSLSINPAAPTGADAPSTNNRPEWGRHLAKSRNLLRVSKTSGKVDRLYKGANAIRHCFSLLPSTKHPDLINEPYKWCIECNPLLGLPDSSGQSDVGVGGLIVIVHGEFLETETEKQHGTITRSFDRTFVLGPGGGTGGLRVVCDTLVLRPYGGYRAWIVQTDEENISLSSSKQPLLQHQVQVPPGFGNAGNGKGDEQVQKEVLALELSKGTGMTLEFSGMCLEQSAWNLEEAARRFEQAKVCLSATRCCHVH